jgi:hypothetical protein
MDVSPDMPKKARSEEVRFWLSERPKVSRYVVIDDEDDELDGLPLFQPSAKTGLTAEIVKGVERYLAGKSDATMQASLLVRAGLNLHALLNSDKN